MNPLLEIIALNSEDARRAADGGADRLEICGDMSDDGTTPLLRTVESILQARLPLNTMVMVRPRGGGFVHTDEEIRRMAQDIRVFKEMGVWGVVFGCLNRYDRVDTVALEALTDETTELSMTFHRAFDSAGDKAFALDTLAVYGIGRVLTLGYPCGTPRRPTDVNGVLDTRRLAAGRLSVMTGGWLDERTLRECLKGGIREFHLGRAVRGAEGYASPVETRHVRSWRDMLDRLQSAVGDSQ